jgi:hypothetical protein
VSFDQARWLLAYAEAIAAGAPFPPILDAADHGRFQMGAPGFPSRRQGSLLAA